MGKHGWNGNFKDSKYVETGNMVNDVIENNGRILHEATSDGYTHFIMYMRFFPKIPSRKIIIIRNIIPSIHYLIRISIRCCFM